MTVKTRALIAYPVEIGAAAPLFKMEDVEIPELEEGQLLVQMVATGLCHSDVTLALDSNVGGERKVLGHEGISLISIARRFLR